MRAICLAYTTLRRREVVSMRCDVTQEATVRSTNNMVAEDSASLGDVM